jgi:hypothetical protein
VFGYQPVNHANTHAQTIEQGYDTRTESGPFRGGKTVRIAAGIDPAYRAAEHKIREPSAAVMGFEITDPLADRRESAHATDLFSRNTHSAPDRDTRDTRDTRKCRSGPARMA